MHDNHVICQENILVLWNLWTLYLLKPVIIELSKIHLISNVLGFICLLYLYLYSLSSYFSKWKSFEHLKNESAKCWNSGIILNIFTYKINYIHITCNSTSLHLEGMGTFIFFKQEVYKNICYSSCHVINSHKLISNLLDILFDEW